MKGSLTVEASLIFPFSLMIILFICHLGIYQYDCAVMKMTGYECILQMMDAERENSDNLKKELQLLANKSVKDRCFGIMELETSVKMTSSKVQLIYLGKQGMLQIPFEISLIYERCNPEVTLRVNRQRRGEAYE